MKIDFNFIWLDYLKSKIALFLKNKNKNYRLKVIISDREDAMVNLDK